MATPRVENPKRWRFDPDQQKRVMMTDDEWQVIVDAHPELQKAESEGDGFKPMLDMRTLLAQEDLAAEVESLQLEMAAYKQNYHATTDVRMKAQFKERVLLIEARLALVLEALELDHEEVHYGHATSIGFLASVPLSEGIKFNFHRYVTRNPLDKAVLNRLIAGNSEPNLRVIPPDARAHFDVETKKFTGWFTEELAAQLGVDLRNMRRVG